MMFMRCFLRLCRASSQQRRDANPDVRVLLSALGGSRLVPRLLLRPRIPRAARTLPSPAPAPSAGRAAARHVRPSDCRKAPAADLRMMPRQQHVGHRHPFVHLRPRVVRTIEQPVANESSRADCSSFSAPGNSRAIASISISAGNSPPETTKSPIGDFLVDLAHEQPLVDPFVPARQQHVARIGRQRQRSHPRMRQRRSRRRQVESPATVPTPAACCAARAAPIACASGAASITIPGPPPYGRSSTVR